MKLTISAQHYEVDDKLTSYIKRKLSKLDRYLPRAHKAKAMTVHILRDASSKEDSRYKVKVLLEVAGPDIVAEAATMNPHSAIDIVERKLKTQIVKYKQKHQPKRFSVKKIFSWPNEDKLP